MGPLLLWRHRHALRHTGPLVTNRAAFVREHVDHFLNGAKAQPPVRARTQRRAQRKDGRPSRRNREGTARV
jgi:hypothetical protein